MKNSVLLCFCIAATFVAQAQKKQEVLNFIEKLPTIEYGILPYWCGETYYIAAEENDIFCLVHGFSYQKEDSINQRFVNFIKTVLCDSTYAIINGKKNRITFKGKEWTTKNDRGQYVKLDNKWGGLEGYSSDFTPSLFASAKSFFKEKYYVVYFWEAQVTEDITYYTLVFDFNGNLLSYHSFDSWNAGAPLYPFDSSANIVRCSGESFSSQVAYLPNGLILAKAPNTLKYGGHYELSYLNENGHYEIIKSWKELGGLEEVLVNDGKYVNYERVDLDDNNNQIRQLIQIPFVVHDKDGYANIRAEASGNAKVIRTINDGDMVWGAYLPNGWCKIAFTADSNGKIVEGGYIHSSRLEKISDPKNDEFVKLPSREEWEKKLKQ